MGIRIGIAWIKPITNRRERRHETYEDDSEIREWRSSRQ
jgi:hypothetical protein